MKKKNSANEEETRNYWNDIAIEMWIYEDDFNYDRQTREISVSIFFCFSHIVVYWVMHCLAMVTGYLHFNGFATSESYFPMLKSRYSYNYTYWRCSILSCSSYIVSHCYGDGQQCMLHEKYFTSCQEKEECALRGPLNTSRHFLRCDVCILSIFFLLDDDLETWNKLAICECETKMKFDIFIAGRSKMMRYIKKGNL